MPLTAPDSSFMKQLKELDPKLGCEFIPNVPDKFVITYERPIGDPASIWVVKNDDGSFRVPDGRDILKLKASDVHKEDVKTRFRRSAKYMEDYRRDHNRKLEEGIYERTKDDYIQMRRVTDQVDGNPKAMSGAFRKVNPKLKGIKAEEIGKSLS